MPRACSICGDDRLEAIDVALCDETNSLRGLEARFQLGYRSLNRHKTNHLSGNGDNPNLGESSQAESSQATELEPIQKPESLCRQRPYKPRQPRPQVEEPSQSGMKRENHPPPGRKRKRKKRQRRLRHTPTPPRLIRGPPMEEEAAIRNEKRRVGNLEPAAFKAEMHDVCVKWNQGTAV